MGDVWERGYLLKLFSRKRGKIGGVVAVALSAGIPEPGTGQTTLSKSVGLGLELDQRLACAPLGRVGSNPTPGATNNS